jgi:hypothetical protein
MVQEVLSSTISLTTGLEVLTGGGAPEPAVDFVVAGEVAKSGPVYAVQLVLKDGKGTELFRTHRLTAVCGEDDVDDLMTAITQLAAIVVGEIQRHR